MIYLAEVLNKKLNEVTEKKLVMQMSNTEKILKYHIRENLYIF